MIDSLGDRMKAAYENRTRYVLPRRTYTIIRIDGKAFHTYTKGLTRPFDDQLIQDMNETAMYLCQNIMGVKFAYIQSDEISLLLTDFTEIGTEAWFDGNIQKMTSVAASMATSRFNRLRYATYLNKEAIIDKLETPKLPSKDAEFDARVFQIPQKVEVANYFLWRQKDCTKNSISSVAQSLYSHKELNGKDSNAKQELIFQKGINWNDYPSGKKRGRFIEKIEFVNDMPVDKFNDDFEVYQPCYIGATVRNKWTIVECPIFSEDKDFLYNRIPNAE